MSLKVIKLLSVLFISFTLLFTPEKGFSWGTYGHLSISSSAIECLPLSMATIFRPYKSWIASTSTDNGVRTGWDANEDYFHYINIDTGNICLWPFSCISRNYGTYTAQFGIPNGTNPYMVDSLTVVLSTAYRNWNNNKTASNLTTAMLWMCRVAHYMEDLHQPLHVTDNYNPNGVHSRYETNMLEQFKPSVATSIGSGAIYQSNRIEFCFSIISISYPYYHTIAVADTTAENFAGNTFSFTYYSTLWANTQSFTTTLLNKGAIDVASIWYTAWVNAGITSLNDWTDYSQSINEPSANLPQRREYNISLDSQPLN